MVEPSHSNVSTMELDLLDYDLYY